MTAGSDFLESVVKPAIYPARRPLDVAAYHVRGEPIPANDAIRSDYEPFAAGDPWGGMWSTTWFRFRASVPGEWSGREVVALVHLGGDDMVGFSAEGLIWNTDVVPVQGLHHRHREYIILGDQRPEVEFYVEAAANPIPRWHKKEWPLLGPDYEGPPLYVLRQADLAVVDRDVEALYLDGRLMLQMARQFPEMSDAIEAALAKAAIIFDADDPSPSRDSLKTGLNAPNENRHRVIAVGHAHIDSAWLWPVRETKRKCARTFANQLRLMDRYPDHHFVCSQAAQYRWIKDGYPALFDQIKERVRDGHWEPVGGMWVEPDCNVPSGESLVRQIVYGKRFFADEFGVETHELWIPDVFGYSAALPQIAAQAGITALVTQKMSWNDTNVFPHSTFWWEGHDGSRLLAHFPPADTYNGEFTVLEVAKSESNFKDRERSGVTLYPFGFGDGGGGPTARMLEQSRRMEGLEHLPNVEVASVADFFERVRAEAPQLETWAGELYLEYHRGTLTTHADVKLANRRGEEALRAAELWSVAAGRDCRAELDEAWKLLLLNQFHDILPGSSIHWVYEDTAREHAAVLEAAETVKEGALASLASPLSHTSGLLAFNAGSYEREEVIALPSGALARVSVPSCGWAPVPVEAQSGDVEVGAGWLQNGLLRVEWDDRGLLTSVWDRSVGREVLAAGRPGNVFQLHEDNPKAFDAWEVEPFDEPKNLVDIDSMEIVEDDPLRCGIRFVRRFGSSTVDQTMRLSAGSRRLEFHTSVDWHEDHRLLKVAFPVAVRAPRATYEIQHGHIERPTVTNTSWDRARFEVCAHRWADLSEPGYGVALLNDCKYGYDIRGDVMRLSLLRAPGYPDPKADRGHHHFAYALMPHPGDLRGDGRVVEEAEAFNLPIRVVTGDRPRDQVLHVDRPGVSIEAVKWADRGEGVVVRLCEVWGSRGAARLTLNVPFAEVSRVDLLERPLEPVAHDGSSVDLRLRPFELVTLLFN